MKTKHTKVALEQDDRIRTYLSGPMRGLPDYNYPVFHQVEEAWLERYPDDLVLNPAKNFDGDTTLPIATYFQKDLEQLLSAQMIVLLPGWENSEGASQYEVPVARVTGKIFFQAERYCDSVDGKHIEGWEFNMIEPPRPERGAATVNESGDAKSERARLLDEAKGLVTGDRNNSYGPPTQDFERSANALNAYGYRGPQGRLLKAHDVAILIMSVKLSRLMWTPQKRDSWVDIAGYAACGIECAIEEDEKARSNQGEPAYLTEAYRPESDGDC